MSRNQNGKKKKKSLVKFFLETQILFLPMNINRITHSPKPWVLHRPWKWSMCGFSLLAFWFLLWFSLSRRPWRSGLGVGRGYLQKLPDSGRMAYGRQKKGFSPTHGQATPPEKLPSPRCEMTTDTFIYWTSLFLVPTASPASQIRKLM